jgi:hypothetical protein
MKRYQYQLVRYIHDRTTAEFVNVGVIIFHPETKFLKSCFIGKYGRISHFFNEINGHYLISTLKQFEKAIEEIAKRSDDLFFNHVDISSITSSILPKDDSALECSEIFEGIDFDLDAALSDLFDRMVDKYSQEIDAENHDDKYVWKNIYKKHFDHYEITKKLKAHSVQTINDVILFDKSWKNGIWHCYQTLSFDLKQVDTIKNKVYKWSGILNELDNSTEELHIHFLTASPSKHKSLQKFIDNTLVNRKSNTIKVSLVKESQAAEFAFNVNQEISEHNQ